MKKVFSYPPTDFEVGGFSLDHVSVRIYVTTVILYEVFRAMLVIDARTGVVFLETLPTQNTADTYSTTVLATLKAP